MFSNKHNNLINLIKDSQSLKFIDVESNKIYYLNDMLFDLDTMDLPRSLGFLYLDTSLISLKVYLTFLNSPHALVLLSDSIDLKLKENLEDSYLPTFIIDSKRAKIPKYTTDKITGNASIIDLHINTSYTTKLHENIKILLSTSGTTGSPKLVKLSEDNILKNALSICEYLPIATTDVTPLNLPLHYSYGLSVLHSNAISGTTIVCGLPDILNKDFWNYLEEHKFTSIAGVPFIYEMLKRIGFMKKSYPSLKYITQAGGNLSQNIKMEFYEYCNDNAIEFFVMYGQTEATARISYVPPADLKNKITSIGKPIKNGKITIDDKTGELLYSGPNVFGGYANEIENLACWEDIVHLRTGDLADKDEHGFYYIKGRLKRIVKVFGNRINLDEIEAYLKSRLNMSLLACTGIDDKILLIAHSNEALNESELKKAIFASYKIQGSAIKFKYFEELPKNKSDKIDYNKIILQYLDN
ncbi:AMP-binding protein [Gelidibacter salicanalis]|uniref:AMP-binding protein n=1 Tax=Gelidibacter salicanalis TaxID=291193 RepID=A0A934NJJ7_9FLAO|nr:AMP-binding protein [Gelidibacter salicanalis]MBJ7882703.1 AMP-binding protein [Gelidibacter salicanalis]